MIDYERLEKGVKGIEPANPPVITMDELTASKLENARLKEVIEVQKLAIKRFERLLGQGLRRR